MVVPVGLQMEARDNNDPGLFPQSSHSSRLLHTLQEEQNHPAKLSVENMESTKDVDPAAVPVQHNPVQLKSWSSCLASPPPGSRARTSYSYTSTTSTPRSSFLQLLSLPPPSPGLVFQSQQPPLVTTLELLKPREENKRGSTTAGSLSANAAGSKMRSNTPSVNRRDDAALHRVGKMTSLGASPKCNVCSHKPNEARVVTFCGHLFCWPCLCCWLHNKSPDKECPVCNRPLTKNHITPLHGRQNNLTVARLQGMLRPDKPTSRTSSTSRGEGGSSSGKRHGFKSSSSPSPAKASYSATSVTLAGTSSTEATSKRDTTPRKSDSNHDPPASVEDTITRILSKRPPAAQMASCSYRYPPLLAEQEQLPVLVPSSRMITQLCSSPATQQYQYIHPHVLPGQLSSTLSMNAISTPSTIVTTGVIPVGESSKPPEMVALPGGGSGEMGELGVLLSLEWEGAMSAIENAWWNAVSDVLNKNARTPGSTIGEVDTSRLMTMVERLSMEKEKIIHELASEPLESSSWLPERLDSFRTMTQEEFGCISPGSGQEYLVEIDDWFVDSPDEGESLFPEMMSSQDEAAAAATPDVVEGELTSQWMKQPADLKPCRLQKKRKMNVETELKNYFQL